MLCLPRFGAKGLGYKHNQAELIATPETPRPEVYITRIKVSSHLATPSCGGRRVQDKTKHRSKPAKFSHFQFLWLFGPYKRLDAWVFASVCTLADLCIFQILG